MALPLTLSLFLLLSNVSGETLGISTTFLASEGGWGWRFEKNAHQRLFEIWLELVRVERHSVACATDSHGWHRVEARHLVELII